MIIEKCASITWDFWDVHKQWITLYGEYNTWVIVQNHFKIIITFKLYLY